jgi:chemotaxis protein CheD
MTTEYVVKVGMADLNVIKDTGVLKTTGLGSCVGLTLYDPRAGVAGMAHIMLPTSDIAREGQINMAKYADTAVPLMIEKMNGLGAEVRRMQAKMAGGAQMFAFSNSNDTLRIGPRNVDSCKELLEHYKIPLISEDTGGNFGRTIEFHSETGVLCVRSFQHGVKEI